MEAFENYEAKVTVSIQKVHQGHFIKKCIFFPIWKIKCKGHTHRCLRELLDKGTFQYTKGSNYYYVVTYPSENKC